MKVKVQVVSFMITIYLKVISLWFDVQRTWSHLESIFIGSEDIRKQLPTDSERFDNIDSEFKELMVTMSKTPNVVKVKMKDHKENFQDNFTIYFLN